jgi:hypothetical protein
MLGESFCRIDDREEAMWTVECGRVDFEPELFSFAREKVNPSSAYPVGLCPAIDEDSDLNATSRAAEIVYGYDDFQVFALLGARGIEFHLFGAKGKVGEKP